VSLHLLNLNFYSIEGLAEEFTLLHRWNGHGGGGGRQSSNSLVKGRKLLSAEVILAGNTNPVWPSLDSLLVSCRFSSSSKLLRNISLVRIRRSILRKESGKDGV